MRERMRADLRTAMKGRDRTTVSVLRSALAAIENAEAQPVEEVTVGAPVELGSTERPRRQLAAADVRAIVENEIDELAAAAAAYERMGRPDLAEPLRVDAGVLSRYLAPT